MQYLPWSNLFPILQCTSFLDHIFWISSTYEGLFYQTHCSSTSIYVQTVKVFDLKNNIIFIVVVVSILVDFLVFRCRLIHSWLPGPGHALSGWNLMAAYRCHFASNTSEPSASLLGLCLFGCHHFTLAADRLMLHPCLVFLKTLFILKPIWAQLFIINKSRLEAFSHPHSPHFHDIYSFIQLHTYNGMTFLVVLLLHLWQILLKNLILKSFTFSDDKRRVMVLLYTISAVKRIQTCCTAEPS